MNLIDQLRKTILDGFSKIIHEEAIVTFLTSIVMIIFWVLLTYVMILLTRRFVRKTRKYELKETKQTATVKRLITNIIRSLFIFWIVIMILKEVGIDVMPVLAGAGVVAFAVGFGAQKLIKDVISGCFLIIDKTFSIGDLVEINDVKGFIADIGIRTTKITTWKNDVVTINNGDINMVTNFSLNPSLAVVDFKLPQDVDITFVESKKFTDFLAEFKKNHPEIIEMSNKAVVTSLMDEGVILRITGKTNNLKNGSVETELRKALLEYFDKEDISFAKTTMIQVNEKK